MRTHRLAAAAICCALAGCWDSVGPPGGGAWADGTGGDGGDPEGTDDLVGWECADLSPCVQSDLSGFTCPGFPPAVHCWDFGAACSADYLCASAAQACEIACAATSCGQSGATPPHPICD